MFPLHRGAATWLLLIISAVVTLDSVTSSGENRVVCYYTNWSVYRPGTAKFSPQNINPYLCTHLIYAFGGFTKDNTLKPFDKYQDIEQGGYAKFTGLKTYNKNLKTMLAIGGWNEASSRFSPLVANADRRQKFIRNIVKFLRQNHFDGLDLDWEYPAFRDGGKSRDRDNYAQFVQELREEFERETSKTGRPRLLLTMAVPAGIEYIEKGYDIKKLNRYLDWFNLLTYDYHSAFEPAVNHHAPLYPLEEESEYNYDTELNIDYSVKFYLNAGADADKLVLGIPTYGRSYTLFNPEATEIGAPADGPGDQGDATREKGYLAYYEICQSLIDDPDWTVVQPNNKAVGPYAFKDNQWVGYDDIAIVKRKAEYVSANGLGGIMFWSIDNDDFRGTCHGKAYPLIEAAKDALLNGVGSGVNDIGPPARAQKPNRQRSRPGTSSTRNRLTSNFDTESKEKESKPVFNKGVQSTQTRKPATSRRRTTSSPSTTTERTVQRTTESLYIGGRQTTPAPPTTPDPGSDFKCEDEGFYPHPRDCKKYFWCLDSGPSNLGIVAHQFTCPSGLFFNKQADSCDYSRNVVCKLPKDEPTTTTTTTSKPITTTVVTTLRPKITAATSRLTFLRTTTTTTAAPEEEYEDYSDEEVKVPGLGTDSEEDPRVIKELIDLIKKVGGLEQLERQLRLQDNGSAVLHNTQTKEITTTPASISKSLYERVLSRAAAGTFAPRNRFGPAVPAKSSEVEEEVEEKSEITRGESKYTSINRNSRPGPQNAGLDSILESEGFIKDKPKYVTITRTRPTAAVAEETDNDEDDEEINEERITVTERVESRYTNSQSQPQYVNIRRQRLTTLPTTDVEENSQENIEKDVVQEVQPIFNKRPTQTTSSPNTQYSNFVRQSRPVTSTTVETETDAPVTVTRYKFLERTRLTTTPAPESEAVTSGIDERFSKDEQTTNVQAARPSNDGTTLVSSKLANNNLTNQKLNDEQTLSSSTTSTATRRTTTYTNIARKPIISIITETTIAPEQEQQELIKTTQDTNQLTNLVNNLNFNNKQATPQSNEINQNNQLNDKAIINNNINEINNNNKRTTHVDLTTITAPTLTNIETTTTTNLIDDPVTATTAFYETETETIVYNRNSDDEKLNEVTKLTSSNDIKEVEVDTTIETQTELDGLGMITSKLDLDSDSISQTQDKLTIITKTTTTTQNVPTEILTTEVTPSTTLKVPITEQAEVVQTTTVSNPRPFGFSRRTRFTTTTSSPTVSDAKVSTTVANRTKTTSPDATKVSLTNAFGVNKNLYKVNSNFRNSINIAGRPTKSTILDDSIASSSSTSGDVNEDNVDSLENEYYSLNSLSQRQSPGPFSPSVPLPTSPTVNTFNRRPFAKRPTNSGFTIAASASTISSTTRVPFVDTANAEEQSQLTTERPRYNVIRSRGNVRYRPYSAQVGNDVEIKHRSQPTPTRPYRPQIHSIESEISVSDGRDNNKYANQGSTQDYYVDRPLRPEIESDLSSLISVDLNKARNPTVRVNVAGNTNANTNIIRRRPVTTQSTTSATSTPEVSKAIGGNEAGSQKTVNVNDEITSKRRPVINRFDFNNAGTPRGFSTAQEQTGTEINNQANRNRFVSRFGETDQTSSSREATVQSRISGARTQTSQTNNNSINIGFGINNKDSSLNSLSSTTPTTTTSTTKTSITTTPNPTTLNDLDETDSPIVTVRIIQANQNGVVSIKDNEKPDRIRFTLERKLNFNFGSTKQNQFDQSPLDGGKRLTNGKSEIVDLPDSRIIRPFLGKPLDLVTPIITSSSVSTVATPTTIVDEDLTTAFINSELDDESKIIVENIESVNRLESSKIVSNFNSQSSETETKTKNSSATTTQERPIYFRVRTTLPIELDTEIPTTLANEQETEKEAVDTTTRASLFAFGNGIIKPTTTTTTTEVPNTTQIISLDSNLKINETSTETVVQRGQTFTRRPVDSTTTGNTRFRGRGRQTTPRPQELITESNSTVEIQSAERRPAGFNSVRRFRTTTTTELPSVDEENISEINRTRVTVTQRTINRRPVVRGNAGQRFRTTTNAPSVAGEVSDAFNITEGNNSGSEAIQTNVRQQTIIRRPALGGARRFGLSTTTSKINIDEEISEVVNNTETVVTKTIVDNSSITGIQTNVRQQTFIRRPAVGGARRFGVSTTSQSPQVNVENFTSGDDNNTETEINKTFGNNSVSEGIQTNVRQQTVIRRPVLSGARRFGVSTTTAPQVIIGEVASGNVDNIESEVNKTIVSTTSNEENETSVRQQTFIRRPILGGSRRFGLSTTTAPQVNVDETLAEEGNNTESESSKTVIDKSESAGIQSNVRQQTFIRRPALSGSRRFGASTTAAPQDIADNVTPGEVNDTESNVNITIVGQRNIVRRPTLSSRRFGATRTTSNSVTNEDVDSVKTSENTEINENRNVVRQRTIVRRPLFNTSQRVNETTGETSTVNGNRTPQRTVIRRRLGPLTTTTTTTEQILDADSDDFTSVNEIGTTLQDEVTTRRQFGFSRPRTSTEESEEASSTTENNETQTTPQDEVTTRRQFSFNRPISTTENSEDVTSVSENNEIQTTLQYEVTTRRQFAFNRPRSTTEKLEEATSIAEDEINATVQTEETTKGSIISNRFRPTFRTATTPSASSTEGTSSNEEISATNVSDKSSVSSIETSSIESTRTGSLFGSRRQRPLNLRTTTAKNVADIDNESAKDENSEVTSAINRPRTGERPRFTINSRRFGSTSTTETNVENDEEIKLTENNSGRGNSVISFLPQVGQRPKFKIESRRFKTTTTTETSLLENDNDNQAIDEEDNATGNNINANSQQSTSTRVRGGSRFSLNQQRTSTQTFTSNRNRFETQRGRTQQRGFVNKATETNATETGEIEQNNQQSPQDQSEFLRRRTSLFKNPITSTARTTEQTPLESDSINSSENVDDETQGTTEAQETVTIISEDVSQKSEKEDVEVTTKIQKRIKIFRKRPTQASTGNDETEVSDDKETTEAIVQSQDISSTEAPTSPTTTRPRRRKIKKIRTSPKPQETTEKDIELESETTTASTLATLSRGSLPTKSVTENSTESKETVVATEITEKYDPVTIKADDDLETNDSIERSTVQSFENLGLTRQGKAQEIGSRNSLSVSEEKISTVHKIKVTEGTNDTDTIISNDEHESEEGITTETNAEDEQNDINLSTPAAIVNALLRPAQNRPSFGQRRPSQSAYTTSAPTTRSRAFRTRQFSRLDQTQSAGDTSNNEQNTPIDIVQNRPIGRRPASNRYQNRARFQTSSASPADNELDINDQQGDEITKQEGDNVEIRQGTNSRTRTRTYNRFSSSTASKSNSEQNSITERTRIRNRPVGSSRFTPINRPRIEQSNEINEEVANDNENVTNPTEEEFNVNNNNSNEINNGNSDENASPRYSIISRNNNNLNRLTTTIKTPTSRKYNTPSGFGVTIIDNNINNDNNINYNNNINNNNNNVISTTQLYDQTTFDPIDSDKLTTITPDISDNTNIPDSQITTTQQHNNNLYNNDDILSTQLPFDIDITTTIDNTIIDNENINNINVNINQLQDNEDDLNGTKVQSNQINSNHYKYKTTTVKPTTLHHIFAIDYDSSELNSQSGGGVDAKTTTEATKNFENNKKDSTEEISQRLDKLVEINRIVEVYSKQDKLTYTSKKNTSENGNLMVEKIPTIDKLGEISRFTSIKLQNSRQQQQLVANESLDDYDRINNINNSILPTIQEAGNEVSKMTIEDTALPGTTTSAITIGYKTDVAVDSDFHLNHKGEVIAKVEEIKMPDTEEEAEVKLINENIIKKGRNLVYPEVVLGVETSTIPLEGLFNGRQGKAQQESHTEKTSGVSIVYATSPSDYKKYEESLIEKRNEEISAVTEQIDETITERHYRPLAPFLRPESDEQAPLVISIANLDQVVLSRIANEQTEYPNEETTTDPQPIVNMEQSFSSETTHVLQKRGKKVVNGGDTVTATTPTDDSVESTTIIAKVPIPLLWRKSTSTEQKTVEQKQTPQRPTYRPGFRRPTQRTPSPLRTLPPFNNLDTTESSLTGAVGAQFTRRGRPTPFSTTTTSATQVITTTIKPRIVIRRRFGGPRPTINNSTGGETITAVAPTFKTGGGTRRIISTTTPSPDINDTEPPKVANPLFRRRFNFTQPKRVLPVATTTETPLTTILDLPESITTTLKTIDEKSAPTGGLDKDQDQEVDSSIYQEDTKFINSRYNQIGELSDIDDDAAEGLLTISKAPLPFSVQAGSTTSRYIATTGRQPERNTQRIQQQQTIPDYEYNGPIVTTTRRNGLLSTTSRRNIARRPQRPVISTTVVTSTTPRQEQLFRRLKPQPFERVTPIQNEFTTARPKINYRPISGDYDDYYDDGDLRIVGKTANSQVKVILHGPGVIECLDQGNFPHPLSCRKFISCAKMETGGVVGWEYTCPKGLSYDPVGGICNWSAGLGCNE